MAKAKDWSKIYKKYKGQWVALADDEETVMGNGKTAKERKKRCHKRKGVSHLSSFIKVESY